MGKARDVVKVTFGSIPSLRPAEDSKLVFDTLKQHFSEVTYSSMPLADFYNTLPLARESPMNCWIRFNKAVNVADECLRRQGWNIEDPSHEVSMMFVKHCPDTTLANEIHEHLIKNQRETRTKPQGKTYPPPQPKQVATHAQTSAMETVAADNARVQWGLFSGRECLHSVPHWLAGPRAGAEGSVSSCNTTKQGASKLPSKEMQVCQFDDHSTTMHCRQENLCMRSWAIGGENVNNVSQEMMPCRNPARHNPEMNKVEQV